MDFEHLLHPIIHAIEHAIKDSAAMLPFLYAAFLLMEFIEHHSSNKLSLMLEKAGHSRLGGTAAGAALGCVPQCGFSIAATNLYSSRIISAGTLMAVYISTSDEAVPILIAHPDRIGELWKLIAAKVIIAVIGGILFSFIADKLLSKDDEADFDELCSDCGCGKHGIWLSALKHTVSIFIFIFIVNLIMGIVMELAGEDNVKAFLNGMGIWQPFAAALIGMIPNCASSVILTELFANGSIPFGTAVGGLCTGAGMGLAVLFKTNRKLKDNLIFVAFLYIIGVVSGILINAAF
ncbi:MAG: arsenic efflux protein [Oscillospiraceae bacterium]|nr:arsenic efflux protein [Oscillospiraceae bacterium]